MKIFQFRARSKKKRLQEVHGKRYEEVAGQHVSSWSMLLPELMQLGVKLVKEQIDREFQELVGNRYGRKEDGVYRWGSQRGSIYVQDERVGIEKPRVRHRDQGELQLPTYERFSKPNEVDEQCYKLALRGISTRDYPEVVRQVANGFGLSKSSVSRNVIRATQERFDTLMNRDLSQQRWFAVFLDGKSINGEMILAAVGADEYGKKQALGIHQAATENAEAVRTFLESLIDRGLLEGNEDLLFVTDGSKGIIKALKQLFGKRLWHQRCFKHKDFNLENHLPKRYVPECKRRLRAALSMNSEKDARKEIMVLVRWLKTINLSAANSLLEGLDSLLTCHCLQIPPALAKSLYTTNGIESVFSVVDTKIKRNKRWRNSTQIQRWMAAGLLEAEGSWRRLRGYRDIPDVIKRMKQINLAKERKAA